MKKLLMGAAVLFLFSLSLLVVQSSCSKSSAIPLDNPQLSKIVFFKESGVTKEIWTANYDGTSSAKIPLVLPSNVSLDNNAATKSLSVSPDGQTIFFTAIETTGSSQALNIYSCDISGNNLKIVIQGTSGVSASHHPVAF